MASSDTRHTLEQLLARASEPLPEPTWESPSDLGRMSVEALVADTLGNARGMPSRGQLRLHGPGVHGHRARLTAVSQITSAWQRAVTAVGASLEGHKNAAGQVKADIKNRTELMLSAAPAPGSVVLMVEPFTYGVDEVEPRGQAKIVSDDRPLADRASSRLIDLCQHLAVHDVEESAAKADEIRELGPRVASAVLELASSIASANVAFDATWEEPQHITVRSRWSTGVGLTVKEFVEGHDLASYPEQITGVVLTLSVSERWRVDTGEEVVSIDARELDSELTRKPRLQSVVEIDTRVSIRRRADGAERITREALGLRVLSEAETSAWVQRTGVLIEGDPHPDR